MYLYSFKVPYLYLLLYFNLNLNFEYDYSCHTLKSKLVSGRATQTQQTYISNKHNMFKSQLAAGGKPVAYLESVTAELSTGLPRINPANERVERLNPQDLRITKSAPEKPWKCCLLILHYYITVHFS